MKKIIRNILLDADVISHFYVANRLIYLVNIFSPHKILIPIEVYNESIRLPGRKSQIDRWITSDQNINVLDLPNFHDFKMEYARIKKIYPLIGNGERACMAIAKFDKSVIASSNFRDISSYCEDNNIDYLGTLDILVIACRKGIFTENDCNCFIYDAKNKNNAKFPSNVNKISEYNDDRYTKYFEDN